MGAALNKFLDWLKHLVSKPREPYLSSSELFPELDLREVQRDLTPAQRGRENGQRDLPASDATDLDHVERHIVAFIVGQQKRAQNTCEQQLQVYDERLRNLAVTFLHSNVAGRVQAGCADLRELGKRARNELFDLQRRVTSLATELMEFRATHRLSRAAEYPESTSWHIALLGFVILAETVLNGLMLAQGTEGGRLEGFTQAFVLSLFNVSIGFVLGRLALPMLQHRVGVLRAIGAVMLPLGVLCSVAFNLFVGHYRDALGGINPTNAARDAGAAFVSDPFHLADLNSWALCALGIVFAAIAIVDTYRMDDPYWGFGRMWRRNEQARLDFVVERQQLMSEASGLRDDVLDTIHRAAEDIMRAGQHAATLSRQQQGMVDRFNGYQAYLERTGAVLLGQYRAENERARHTPSPQYFREEWRLPRVTGSLAATEYPIVTDLASRVDRYRADIMAAFEEAVAEIKSVEDLVLTGESSMREAHHINA